MAPSEYLAYESNVFGGRWAQMLNEQGSESARALLMPIAQNTVGWPAFDDGWMRVASDIINEQALEEDNAGSAIFVY